MNKSKNHSVPPDNVNYVSLAGYLCGEDYDENQEAHNRYSIYYDKRHKLTAYLSDWELHERQDNNLISVAGVVGFHPCVEKGTWIYTLGSTEVEVVGEGVLVYFDCDQIPNYYCAFEDMNADDVETRQIINELKKGR